MVIPTSLTPPSPAVRTAQAAHLINKRKRLLFRSLFDSRTNSLRRRPPSALRDGGADGAGSTFALLIPQCAADIDLSVEYTFDAFDDAGDIVLEHIAACACVQ